MAQTTTMQVYYLGTYSGKGKTSGKAYHQVRILEYSERFSSWRENSLFIDRIPDICKTLSSGDLVEIEVQSNGLTQAPRLTAITEKIADSTLEIPE